MKLNVYAVVEWKGRKQKDIRIHKVFTNRCNAEDFADTLKRRHTSVLEFPLNGLTIEFDKKMNKPPKVSIE